MLIASFFFACMTAFVKFTSSSVGTFEIVFYRSLIGLLVVLVLMLTHGVSIKTHYLKGHIKRSILGTIAFTMWFSTMGHLPLGTATTLNYTAPLFIAAVFIYMALRKKEEVPWRLGLAILIGFIGVCMILQPSVNSEQLSWALIGLGAGALGPIIFFQIKQLGILREPSWRIVFYFSLVGTVWGLIGTFIFDGGMSLHLEYQSWFGLLAVGICGAIAQICMTKAYAYGNMLLSACFQFATIPISELISYFIFKESVPVEALFGMACILVAGCTATIITKKVEANRAKEPATTSSRP